MTTSSFDHQSNTITVPAGVTSRIDARLSQQLGYSRHFVQHILDRGGILVQGRPAKKSLKLRPGDQIMIDQLERFVDGGVMQEATRIPLEIAQETDDYLVLWKPAGVLSHPTSIRDLQTPSVVAFLVQRYTDLPSQGHFMRAGLLHRLDQATQGWMIAAKTERGLSYFKHLFQSKSAGESSSLIKGYCAICHPSSQGREWLGQISAQLPYLLIEDVRPRVPHPIIKQGITKIMSIRQISASQVVVEIELITGRTHQIRYHLSHHGCPILGDYLYDGPQHESLHLAAYKLAFIDMQGQWQVFERDQSFGIKK